VQNYHDKANVDPMKIAIASGKGGTGKTTIAVNLAEILAESNERVLYADCDVEEPNGHLFLNPDIRDLRVVGIPKPEVDMDKCDGCGECGEICRFSAIVVIVDKVLTFPELCHGCGGCSLVCPQNAITEKKDEIGIIEFGSAGNIDFVAGKLKIGQPSGVRIIKEIKRLKVNYDGYFILDAPPGTSCPVIETVRDSDYIMLVTEPTPFGFHDLQLTVDMVRELRLPFGVVINRSDSGYNKVREYCATHDIDLIAEIPDDRRIAEAYSEGRLLIEAIPEHKIHFSSIINYLKQKLKQNIILFNH